MNRDLLPGVERSTIIKVVAIWLVISGILGLCFALPLLGVGILGGATGLGAVAVGQPGEGATLAAASGFLVILGIVSLVLAPVNLVVAWALFNRRQWSRMGVVVIMGLSAVVSLLGIFMGGGLGSNIISLVIDAFIAYFFYTDPGIQTALSG